MIKKVVGSLYAHKSNIKELKSRLSEEQQKIFTVLWNEIIIELHNERGRIRKIVQILYNLFL